jgi:ABC-type phosphate transport system substrate-binding protein
MVRKETILTALALALLLLAAGCAGFGAGFGAAPAAASADEPAADFTAAGTDTAVNPAGNLVSEDSAKEDSAPFASLTPGVLDGNSSAGPRIKTTLEDGAVQKSAKKTFDLWARDQDGKKIPQSLIRVTLNGKKFRPLGTMGKKPAIC